MKEIRLHMDQLDYDPNRASTGFSSGGTMYLSYGDDFFPAEKWYDMPYVLLKQWLPYLISFGSGHTDRCALAFMDGPYQVKLTRQSDGRISCQCMRGNTVQIQFESIDLTFFLRSVAQCLREYDRILHTYGQRQAFAEESRTIRSIITEIRS